MVMKEILMEKPENKCEFNDVFADACESQEQQVGGAGGGKLQSCCKSAVD